MHMIMPASILLEIENVEAGVGRGGANLLLFEKIRKGELNREDWFGYGLRFMYATTYSEFQELGYGISTKGAATGVFQTLVSNGLAGVFATLLFVFSILIKIKNNRLKYVIIGIFLWEYLFYTGSILRETALAVILVYTVLASDPDYPGSPRNFSPFSSLSK